MVDPMEMNTKNKNKNFYISMNHLTIAILLFIIMFSIIHFSKPILLYNTDGSLRQFGIGYRRRTVVPLWLVVILLSILAYSISLFIQ